MARHQPHLLARITEGTDVIEVHADSRHHLENVLRVTSCSVTYTDGCGLFGSGTYAGGIIERGQEERVPQPRQIAIAVAPPRDTARARFLVEKAAELAVSRLVWLRTAHTEGRVPQRKKSEAWARSGLEQSRGAWLMEVLDPVPIADVAAFGMPVFADVRGEPFCDVLPLENPVLCVGPEGGFAPTEVPNSAIRASLGSTILRVETAAIAGAVLFRGCSG